MLPVIVFIGAFLSAVTIEADADLWTHMAYGRHVVLNHEIPRRDMFTYTADGTVWVNHGWGAGVILYIVHGVSGIGGVILLRAALFALACLLVYTTSIELGGSGNAAAASSLACVLVMHCRMLSRPLIFSWAFFALVCLICVRHARRDAGGGPCRRYGRSGLCLISGIIFLLWANLHVGFLMGFGILGISMIGALFPGLPKASLRMSSDEGEKALAADFAIALGVGFLTSLVNPFGLKAHAYPLTVYRKFEFVKQVSEWAPPGGEAYLYPFWAFAALAVITVISRGVAAEGIMKILSLGAMSIQSRRHLEFFAIAAAPVVCVRLAELAARAVTRKVPIYNTTRVRKAIAWAGVFSAAIAGLQWKWRDFGLQLDPALTFAKAGEFLKREPIPGRVFNTYAAGGYLEWLLHPKDKVFIDGRNDVCGTDIAAQNRAVITGQPGWENILNRWRVNYLFLDMIVPFDGSHLFAGDKWVAVYWDDLTVIAVRNTPENAALTAKRPFRRTNPFLMSSAPIAPGDAPAIIEELRAKLAEDPQCALAHLALGNMLILQNDLHYALQHFEQAMAIRGPSAGALMGAGRCMRGLKRNTEAMEAFRRAEYLDSGLSAEIMVETGRTLYSMGRPVDAEMKFKECAAKYPSYIPALMALNKLYIEQNRIPEANEAARRIQELQARIQNN